MSRRISMKQARVASKIYIAKDPIKDFQDKMQQLKSLMLKYGFKDRVKSREDNKNGLIFYDLTLFGEMANVVVSRNENGFGSKSPLKIFIYIPEYNDMCANWEEYFDAIEKINNFIEDVKEIDGLFLK